MEQFVKFCLCISYPSVDVAMNFTDCQYQSSHCGSYVTWCTVHIASNW